MLSITSPIFVELLTIFINKSSEILLIDNSNLFFSFSTFNFFKNILKIEYFVDVLEDAYLFTATCEDEGVANRFVN